MSQPLRGEERSTSAPPGAAIASTTYARRCKEIMALYHDLRQLGAGDIIGLPCIAVIGSQSAGKSSLVEAVTDISVPRDSGTCTRCPMECTVSSAAMTWSCQISLRHDYATDGTKMSPRTGDFGPRLTDKADVEIWIRRAQTAILSPHVHPSQFHNRETQELRDAQRTDPQVLKFSKNVVVVKIYDPSAVDLQFIDLPGLIQNEDQEVITLVRELVEFYIEKKDTLILVTIPMSDEMENQQAVALAKHHDRHGERTIGVLTKPDTLTGASETRLKYKVILEGRAHRLKHGYYAVRLPSEDERSSGMQRATFTQRSSNFFEETEPWSFMHDRSRFGIPNLVTDISRLLVMRIEESLPRLIEEVNTQLASTERLLGNLPPELEGDPIAAIVLRVSELCTHFAGAVYGRNDTRTLIHANRKRYERFRADIQLTAPQFKISNGNEARTYDHVLRYAVSCLPCPELDLKDVRTVIEGSVTWELKFSVPFAAKKMLIQSYIGLWVEPCKNCFNDACSNLSKLIDVLLVAHLAHFPKLQAYIRTLVIDQFQTYKAASLDRLLAAVKLEKDPLFTQNDHYFASKRGKWLMHLHGYRSTKATRRPPEIDSERPIIDLAALYEPEVIVMAEVRAYFDVAYKRIVDTIPLTIEHSLNQALVDNLQGALLSRLFADFAGERGAERLADLVSEDPSVAKTRADLKSLRERLVKMKEKLDVFGRTSVRADDGGAEGDDASILSTPDSVPSDDRSIPMENVSGRVGSPTASISERAASDVTSIRESLSRSPAQYSPTVGAVPLSAAPPTRASYYAYRGR